MWFQISGAVYAAITVMGFMVGDSMIFGFISNSRLDALGARRTGPDHAADRLRHPKANYRCLTVCFSSFGAMNPRNLGTNFGTICWTGCTSRCLRVLRFEMKWASDLADRQVFNLPRQ
jgi:hypothetical protein